MSLLDASETVIPLPSAIPRSLTASGSSVPLRKRTRETSSDSKAAETSATPQRCMLSLQWKEYLVPPQEGEGGSGVVVYR